MYNVYSTFIFENIEDFGFSNDEYINNVLTNISENKTFQNFIIQISEEYLQSINDLKTLFLSKKIIVENDIDLLSKFLQFSLNEIKIYLIKVFYILEEEGKINFLLNINHSNHGLLDSFKSRIKYIKLDDYMINENILSNKIKKKPDSYFLDSNKLFEYIIEQIKKKKHLEIFIENEIEVKNIINEDNESIIIVNNYKNNLKNLLSDIKYDIKNIFLNDINKYIFLKDLSMKRRKDFCFDFIDYYIKLKEKKYKKEFKYYFSLLLDLLYENYSKNLIQNKSKEDIYEYISYCILFIYSKEDFIFFIQSNSQKICEISNKKY